MNSEPTISFTLREEREKEMKNILSAVYDALKEKITHDWHTEYTAMTDKNGCVTLEGFKGEYSVSCGDHEIFYTLSDKKENDTVVIG